MRLFAIYHPVLREIPRKTGLFLCFNGIFRLFSFSGIFRTLHVFQQSGRDIRLQTDLDRCIIRAEGSKLYRIYQNLLANALRYSMENTRVYIRVTGTQTEFSCCIQNTSSYEMHFTPEEITERFTRGDTMRSTEGSGLGLAISKSFAEACGGGFRVAIDGDQFKAILTFPCCGSDAAPEA